MELNRARRAASLLLVGGAVCLSGCGSNGQSCGYHSVLIMGPGSASADHTAAAPANQVQFTAAVGEATAPGAIDCAIPEVLERVNASWTVSDTVHVGISSAAGSTNGLATCLGATDGAATVTATYAQSSGGTLTATASLSCK